MIRTSGIVYFLKLKINNAYNLVLVNLLKRIIIAIYYETEHDRMETNACSYMTVES